MTPIFMRIWLMKITSSRFRDDRSACAAPGSSAAPACRQHVAHLALDLRLGVSAATESITITSTAPDRTSVSAISRACSPVSGWEMMSSSRIHAELSGVDRIDGVFGVHEAATPPFFWASATTCRASVVLPDDPAQRFDDPAAGYTRRAERNIEPQGPGGYRLHLHGMLVLSELHDGSLCRKLRQSYLTPLRGLSACPCYCNPLRPPARRFYESLSFVIP